MNDLELRNLYKEKIEHFSNKLAKAKKLNRNIVISRGVVFILAVLSSIIIYKVGLLIFFFQLSVFLAFFLFLVKHNIKIQENISYFKEMILIIEKEISSLNYDFSKFENGSEFTDAEHKFSFDLDFFGENSIFQIVNRTCTFRGKYKLAEFLKNPLKSLENIKERQNAVKEIEKQIDWRLNFLTTGNLFKENFDDNQNLRSLTESTEFFHKKKFLNFIRFFVPALTLIFLFLAGTEVVSYTFFSFLYVIQFGIIGLIIKKSNQVHSKVSKKIKLFEKYELLLKEIEKLDGNSELVANLKNKIISEHRTASYEIARLKKLTKWFDNRLNLFFTLFAQGILLWDLHFDILIEKWQNDNKGNIEKWFEVISEIDALISLSTFSYNNQDYVFPEPLNSGGYIFNLKNAGHPMIKKDVLVKNDFYIDKFGHITIVTGANMAGKSTFLRTVGVNLMLAMVGCKVCAEKFEFSPIGLFTSIRNSDSIQKNESYFYAELKRLKSIIDELKKGEKLFVIIDEMLRGTNSKDKHLGSAAMIKRLLNLGAVGIIATHDIDLGKMNSDFPENINNKRFEVDIRNDELFFDYIIKDGISQNLNATFLMKKMEIIV